MKKKTKHDENSFSERLKSIYSKEMLIFWAIVIILGFLFSGGGNKSGNGVICYLEGQVDNKPYKFKRECVYTCYVGDRNEKVLRYEDMPNNCPSFPKHLN